MNKREFLKLGGAASLGAILAPTLTFCSNSTSANIESDQNSGSGAVPVFELPPLPYAYNALEPNIDAMTMEIHHDKHHAGYTKKLNTALEGKSAFNDMSIEAILATISADEGHKAIRNNGGGYYNHSLFWEIMGPNGGGIPSGSVADAINAQFGSYDTFKEEFSKAASGVFGSGWAWLSIGDDRKLFISSTPNQDNPLMKNIVEKAGTPILGLDVWEHAYYLKYQNQRGSYVDNFFNVIDWNNVNKRMDRA